MKAIVIFSLGASLPKTLAGASIGSENAAPAVVFSDVFKNCRRVRPEFNFLESTIVFSDIVS